MYLHEKLPLKDKKLNRGLHSLSIPLILPLLLVFMFVFVNEINSQDLVVDGTENTVAFNGTYQDFILPVNLNVAKIRFTLIGGDGGKVKCDRYGPIPGSCKGNGGEGATVTATFKVGEGVAEDGIIPYGSTVRFIIGGKGESSSGLLAFGTGQGAGGGGGGTGVIFQAPDDPRWHILTIAGGGSGGYAGMFSSVCTYTYNGQGGRASWDGGDGNRPDHGNGGTLGDGGTVGGFFPFELGCGGGGVYTAGGGHKFNIIGTPEYHGHGQAGSDNDYTGGAGGNFNALVTDPGDRYYKVGGFGFGGGGATDISFQQTSGGGGGWSGGGGGGLYGRGGGGASFVSGIRKSQSMTEGGNTDSPANGNASYQAILNTPPVAYCVTTIPIVELDMNGNASILPSLVDAGSYDPDEDEFTLTIEPESFTCENVGENIVVLTITDEYGATDECTAVIDVQDVTQPTVECIGIDVHLNASGFAYIEDDSVDNGSWDACGILSYDTDITEFNCQDAYNYLQDGIPITVTMTVTDVNGNINSCTADVTVLYSENDADCDGVGDECDLCPNGDDSMDYNNDGYPDCYGPYFPGYEDLHPDWTCANNPNQEKLYVCHRPPGNEENFQQICINMSALSAHLDHGDFIGPCIDCPETMEKRAAEFDIQTEIGGFEVYPNPVTDHMYVKVLQLIEGDVQIRITNYLGEIISLIDYPYETETPLIGVDLDDKFISGLYFITLIQDQQIWTKQIIVLK